MPSRSHLRSLAHSSGRSSPPSQPGRREIGADFVPAVKIFMPPGATEPVYAPYVEHLPPDVGAAKLWLLNRQPNRWREKREIEVSGSIEHQIAQMSPEQRLERLRELQAKAALVIECETVEVD